MLKFKDLNDPQNYLREESLIHEKCFIRETVSNAGSQVLDSLLYF